MNKLGNYDCVSIFTRILYSIDAILLPLPRQINKSNYLNVALSLNSQGNTK